MIPLFSRPRCSAALVLGLFLLGSFLPQSALAEERPSTLSIISWNIEWFPGKRRFARGEEMAAHAALVREELKRLDPEVLLAQEMRDWQSFAQLVGVVPGLVPVTVSAFTAEDSGEYWNQQLGIASKVPVLAAWSEPWQPAAIHPRRGFSVAVLRPTPSLELIAIYNVHLKSNRSDSEEQTQLNYATRNESIRQLLAHVAHLEERVFPERLVGVVIGGDFNTNDDGQFDDEVVSMMTEAGFHHTWAGVPREQRLTWRGNNRFEPTTLDHFFTKGLGQPTAQLLTVSDETSDHWPLKLVVDLPESMTAPAP
jgi:endonuclease/exonuclease/phosphatase family metal-dependent hydrolase